MVVMRSCRTKGDIDSFRRKRPPACRKLIACQKHDLEKVLTMPDLHPTMALKTHVAVVPGSLRQWRCAEGMHSGVVVTGEDEDDGPKAFYIQIEARPGREEDVLRMLRDIYGCVLDEPATGPWFAVRYSQSVFGIFEAFPNKLGRDAHVGGGGGDIFRDHARMNELLAQPAHVFRLDVLLNKADIGK